MAEVIRHMSVFYKGKKVATAEGTQYDLDGNDEDVFGDEGWIGATSGAITSKISIDTITPIQGSGVSVIEDMFTKDYVNLTLGVVEGKIHENEMRCRTASYTGENQAGSLKGKWEFMGGKPQITG